jgi:hypothetical protein
MNMEGWNRSLFFTGTQSPMRVYLPPTKIITCASLACALLFPAKTVHAQWWNPFAPKDYEECSESAARDAKSKAALDILLNACAAKFPGRRRPGGGYTYYDIRQNKNFSIAGPNPTPQERDKIDKEYSVYEEQERRAAAAAAEAEAQERLNRADLERRRQQALAEQEIRRQQTAAELNQKRQIAFQNVQVLSSNIECKLSFTREYYTVTARVKNWSREMISGVSLGWVFMPPQQSACPSAYPTKYHEPITLRPGDTAVLNIETQGDGPAREFRYCVGVTGVEIVP